MTNNEINIAFSIHDKDGTYSSKIGVAMVSILETLEDNIKINFYILHDKTLGEYNKDKLKKIVNNYNQKIFFNYIRIEEKDYVKLNGIEVYSPGALFRLKLSETVNVDKILYLDADIICNLNIKKLFEENIEDYAIGAVLDKKVVNKDNIINDKSYKNVPIDVINYFNSGVILFNLKYIRNNYNMFIDTIEFLRKYPDVPYFDQAALNYVFQKKCKFLDSKYNWGVKKGINNECIYHFCGMIDKPWLFKTTPLRVLYWKYFLKTPWCNNLEDFLKEYDKSNMLLEENILTGRILSRKTFVRNFFLRLKKEIFIKLKKNKEI